MVHVGLELTPKVTVKAFDTEQLALFKEVASAWVRKHFKKFDPSMVPEKFTDYVPTDPYYYAPAEKARRKRVQTAITAMSVDGQYAGAVVKGGPVERGCSPVYDWCTNPDKCEWRTDAAYVLLHDGYEMIARGVIESFNDEVRARRRSGRSAPAEVDKDSPLWNMRLLVFHSRYYDPAELPSADEFYGKQQ